MEADQRPHHATEFIVNKDVFNVQNYAHAYGTVITVDQDALRWSSIPDITALERFPYAVPGRCATYLLFADGHAEIAKDHLDPARRRTVR